ncbi:MAG TPA: DNA mismatch repair protein MutS [Candidatus Binataceae bacterium]|nr:DNA mismatch repair protein MutS [Candidatus Binataceae bacterium]
MPIKQTPLVAQYLSVKQKVPDAILFFRLGDFYEMFFEDAEVGARVLDIQLTSRSKDGVPLCGVPYHAAEGYIAKLLKAGLKVAICEQSAPEGGAGGSSGKGGAFQLTGLGDGRAAARGLMPRQIVRVITPGTIGEETVLVADEKNFLLAIACGAQGFGFAALEVSTGEFLTARITGIAGAREELARLSPRELLAPPDNPQIAELLRGLRYPLTRLEAAAFDSSSARFALAAHFGEGLGELDDVIAAAAGAALGYVKENFGGNLSHLRPPQAYQVAEFMLVDETTRRHLELITSSDGGRSGSLLGVLDESLTPIGARTLAHWMVYPLMEIASIRRRHDAVEELFDSDLGGAPSAALRQIGDLERLAGRIGSLRASPRDTLKLSQALGAVAALKAWLSERRGETLQDLTGRLEAQPALAALIDSTISEEPPVNPRDGGAIRRGFSAEIDELRALARDARGVIAQMEAAERERARIPSLKVRYNQVFGYYIEVTRLNLERVPADYERKQTLVGAERFTTPALKELERKILSAEGGLKELELQMFMKLLRELAGHAGAILATAAAVGEFDALMSLALVARRRGYVRPAMDAGGAIKIRDGRHPVLESGMRPGEFVPNDLDCDPDERQLLLITGPNMAGKSTYLRQVALIVIMAQMGSFVPAVEARVSITDRVLTRIGARDELRRGESTFMVEMRETARLLEGLTARSLLLLDEVGRGTSTFDGLAIAWAVAEYLHDATRAKVLFATHFHELTDLARERPRVKNLSMAVREWGSEVLFLRRVVEAPASRSYGIEVARLAGLPASLVARAREILGNLERGELDETGAARLARSPGGPVAPQINLFTASEQRTLDELAAIEVDRLTPIDALNALARIVERSRRRE